MSVVDPDPDSMGPWIRIRKRNPYLGAQIWPSKIEKSSEISFFEVLDVLF
jgi:hypothetical protein